MSNDAITNLTNPVTNLVQLTQADADCLNSGRDELEQLYGDLLGAPYAAGDVVEADRYCPVHGCALPDDDC
jgi:hypothetical protein